jgi:hypothetical protein
MKNEGIQKFLNDVTRRLNCGLAWRVAGWAVLVTGIVLLGHAGLYRINGMEVPWGGALVISFYAHALGVGVWLTLLYNSGESALVADKELGLKDSLATAMEFERKHSEVYKLQLKQTEKLLSEKKAKDLKVELPTRSLAVGGILVAAAILLGFLPNSEDVQKRLDQEALTESRSEEIKTKLEQYVEEFNKKMSADEKEVFNPEELKKGVKGLKRTKDQKEAMRQLARFEQKVTEAMGNMEARKDEEAMKAAAAELAKSDQAAARQLGKNLQLKEFKAAEEALKKFAEAAEFKDPKKMDPKELEKKKEELKKLREMTKRMANAARKRGAGQEKRLGNANGEMVPGNGKDMGQLMDAMDADAKGLQGEIAKGNWQKSNWDKGMKFQKNFNKNLKKFNENLRRMNGKNLAKRRLADLRAGLNKAQRFANGQAQTLGLSQGQMRMKGAGGLAPGAGTDRSKRKARDKAPNLGNVASHEGQKGVGPSITAVEEADSGTGISGRSGETKAREFRRQMESFVRRDDVPEDVKMGVKEYFERVHEVSEEK